jgi:hypothetical protein
MLLQVGGVTYGVPFLVAAISVQESSANLLL